MRWGRTIACRRAGAPLPARNRPDWSIALKVLALETSTPWCSVALYRDGDVRADVVLAGQKHSDLLLPMVDALLRAAGESVRSLDGIAFGAGPGSFTGLRIACGVAQGLALGAGLPLAPVCTLVALAEASGRARVLACLDARMGELYLAACERTHQGWRMPIEPALCKPEHAPALSGEGWFGAGSGFAVAGEALRARHGAQLSGCDGELIPHARAIARLGAAALADGLGVSAAEAAPLYVRDKVALRTDERRPRL